MSSSAASCATTKLPRRRTALTLTQARVLGFAACEPLSQRQLAKHFGCDPSNVSVIVDRLVERSLVQRRPDPRDGRVKLVEATAAGRELAERCCREREWLGPKLDGLSPDELGTVRLALALLVDT